LAFYPLTPADLATFKEEIYDVPLIRKEKGMVALLFLHDHQCMFGNWIERERGEGEKRREGGGREGGERG
jgi:hypothetical protein